MMLSWGGRERREIERCKVDVPCKLLVSGNIWTGTTRDISLTGAFFDPGVENPIPESYLLIQLFLNSCFLTRLSGQTA